MLFLWNCCYHSVKLSLLNVLCKIQSVVIIEVLPWVLTRYLDAPVRGQIWSESFENLCDLDQLLHLSKFWFSPLDFHLYKTTWFFCFLELH